MEFNAEKCEVIHAVVLRDTSAITVLKIPLSKKIAGNKAFLSPPLPPVFIVLFVAMHDDIFSRVEPHAEVRLFADDTIAYLAIKSDHDPDALQNDLDKLAEWEKLWDMEFNAEKCEVIHAGRKRLPVKRDYILHGQTLRSVDSSKYLGVTISANLCWNTHINNITTKANNTLAFLRRNLRVNSRQIKTQAYFGLVRPILEFAASVWDPYTKSNIDKLEKIQRRAARFVCRDYRRTSSVTEMIQSLKWNSLEHRRKTPRKDFLVRKRRGNQEEEEDEDALALIRPPFD
ncbi:putative RNA-directed DNA polymerase from transposon BS [Exaiptasia diaphana]|nr:putative RNA-directed DNA polymerase from transposon BS [Exaiptasia diaphana]